MRRKNIILPQGLLDRVERQTVRFSELSEKLASAGRPGAACAARLLFELLNQMDGLADDADVLFLLTTNRPDILEPALAARPGRVDQAIEVPLPDASCRRRLFELYADKLALGTIRWERFVQRTDGASAAFIREMMRKAALFAADASSDRIEEAHLDEAIHELVVEGGTLTQSLLGFAVPDANNGTLSAARGDPQEDSA